MRERLDEIEELYERLTRELASPEVASDSARLRDVGKKHSEMHDLVAVYRAYRAALRVAEDARLLARAEKDPEMVKYLQGEREDAERRAAELEEQLHVLLLPKDPND